jgi:hypothetical protein
MKSKIKIDCKLKINIKSISLILFKIILKMKKYLIFKLKNKYLLQVKEYKLI